MNNSFAQAGWWNLAPKEPISMVYSSQLAVFIEECMEGLTELQKSAFVLKEVDQEESKNICNVLDISISNLRVLIFRAKDKLRKCLENKLDEKSEVKK
jgi:RNA polymerase sigma-70 factor (ECF subfamily)